MKQKILITGLAGFFGHHFCEHILRNTNWNIIGLDKLSYASKGLDRLRDISCFDEARVQVFTVDLTQPISEGVAREIGQVDIICHIAAETHVDNSIKNPVPFVLNNIKSTLQMLEFAMTQKQLKKFIYFSTDEVFGPAPEGTNYKEDDRYNCTNPYSASKASSEQICKAYANCYKIPLIITRTMNLFGERQHVEKFIPLCIKKILSEERIFIHSNKDKTKAGSRYYIHCRNASDALLFLIKKGTIGEAYHIRGEREVDNLELAHMIAKKLNKTLKYEMTDFHGSRPGHDLRYALDGNKMASLGWYPPKTFEDSLQKTITWTLENKEKWLL